MCDNLCCMHFYSVYSFTPHITDHYREYNSSETVQSIHRQDIPAVCRGRTCSRLEDRYRASWGWWVEGKYWLHWSGEEFVTSEGCKPVCWIMGPGLLNSENDFVCLQWAAAEMEVQLSLMWSLYDKNISKTSAWHFELLLLYSRYFGYIFLHNSICMSFLLCLGLYVFFLLTC